MNEKEYWFDYQINLEEGQRTRFRIALDPRTLLMIVDSDGPKPAWTKLSYNQCQCCPLDPQTHSHCPIAVNIAGLVDQFNNITSHANCLVICETRDRTYSKQTSVMDGLTSIFGIVMATSNCPIMNFLKYMARYHLPFSSVEETTARSTSLFLLEQYFLYKKGLVKAFDFDLLERKYAKVQLVNEGLLARIHSLGEKDADKNAIITLHALSQFLSIEMDFSLHTIAHFFQEAEAEQIE